MSENNISTRFKIRTIGIIITGFLAMYFSCCLGNDSMNVVVPAFQEKFGISYTAASMPFTVGAYVVIFAGFVYSTIIMKHGTRLFGTIAFGLMAVGVIITALSYQLNGTGAVVVMAIGVFISRVIVQAVQLCIFSICANWFVKSRGKILGIVTAGCAIDNASAQALLSRLHTTVGFSNTYYLMGIVLILCAVLAFVFFRTTPQEVGLLPDGNILDDTEEVKTEEEYKTKWTLKKLLSIRESWIIMFAFGIFNMAITCVMGVFSIRIVDVGINNSLAYGALAAAGIIGIFVSPVYGILIDKIGAVKSTALLGLFDTLMFVGFLFGSGNNMIFFYLGIAGVALFVGTPVLNPGLLMSLFGAKEFQAVNRYLNIVINLIAACAVTFMFAIKDITGSFNLGYLIMAILCAVAMILILTIRKSYAEE